jgi:hypothetical protein
MPDSTEIKGDQKNTTVIGLSGLSVVALAAVIFAGVVALVYILVIRDSDNPSTTTGTGRSTLWMQTVQTRHASPTTLRRTNGQTGPRQHRNPCLIPLEYMVVSTQTDPSYCQIHCQFINLVLTERKTPAYY